MSLKQDARLIQLGSDTYYRQRTEVYSPVGGDAILVAPVDYARRQAFSTLFGESVRGGFHDDVSVQFQYNVSARDVNTTTSGTGVVAHSGEQVSAEAGTGVGSALITSKDATKVKSSSWRAGVVASEVVANSSNRWFSNTVLEAAISGGGVRDNIFTLSNPTTFQGKTNHIVVEIGIVTFDNAGNKPVAFYGSINCTLSGATGPTPKDATNSVISLYTGGTVTAGTQGPAATLVKAGGDRRTEVLNTGLLIYPGTTFTIEAVAASAFSGNVSVSCRWVERF